MKIIQETVPEKLQIDIGYLQNIIKNIFENNWKRIYGNFILQWNEECIEKPYLNSIPKDIIIKILNPYKKLENPIFSSKDTLKYTKNDNVYYRIVFSNIERDTFKTYKDLNRIVLNINNKSITIYEPIFMTSVNISLSKINSITFTLILYIDNIGYNNENYKEEFKVKIDDIDYPILYKTSNTIQETFFKYVEKEINTTITKNIAQNLVQPRIKEILIELLQDFIETMYNNNLDFMNKFDITKLINLPKLLSNIEFSNDLSEKNVVVYTSNFTPNNSKPIFILNNGTTILEPVLRIDICLNENEQIESFYITISIGITNIPQNTLYYAKNNNDKYVYIFTKEYILESENA